MACAFQMSKTKAEIWTGYAVAQAIGSGRLRIRVQLHCSRHRKYCDVAGCGFSSSSFNPSKKFEQKYFFKGSAAEAEAF